MVLERQGQGGARLQPSVSSTGRGPARLASGILSAGALAVVFATLVAAEASASSAASTTSATSTCTPEEYLDSSGTCVLGCPGIQHGVCLGPSSAKCDSGWLSNPTGSQPGYCNIVNCRLQGGSAACLGNGDCFTVSPIVSTCNCYADSVRTDNGSCALVCPGIAFGLCNIGQPDCVPGYSGPLCRSYTCTPGQAGSCGPGGDCDPGSSTCTCLPGYTALDGACYCDELSAADVCDHTAYGWVLAYRCLSDAVDHHGDARPGAAEVCGGRGECHAAINRGLTRSYSAVCDCEPGYSGDACESCAPGLYRVGDNCISDGCNVPCSGPGRECVRRQPLDWECVCLTGLVPHGDGCYPPCPPCDSERACAFDEAGQAFLCQCPEGTVDHAGACYADCPVPCAGGKECVFSAEAGRMECLCPAETVDHGGMCYVDCTDCPEHASCVFDEASSGMACACDDGYGEHAGACYPSLCGSADEPVCGEGGQCIFAEGEFACVFPPGSDSDVPGEPVLGASNSPLMLALVITLSVLLVGLPALLVVLWLLRRRSAAWRAGAAVRGDPRV